MQALRIKLNVKRGGDGATELERAQAMLAKWRTSQTGVRFSDLAKVCRLYFGEPAGRAAI